jgi:predicted RNase H-like HicB family nuclease
VSPVEGATPEKREGADHIELRVTADEARHIAALLRYAVSLNTAAGLVSPTHRRLATPTYRAAELAALVLEGHTFEEALQMADEAWTGSLESDHRHALEVLERERAPLLEAMSSRLTPKQLAEYLEVAQQQYLELIRTGLRKPPQEPQR